MADDRMRLVCRKCRESTPIAKFYQGTNWSPVPAVANLMEKFFESHVGCQAKMKSGRFYVLVYESHEAKLGGGAYGLR